MELTERVMRLIPSVLHANGVYMEYTDGDTIYEKNEPREILKDVSKEFIKRSKYSFEIENVHTNAVIEYEREPIIRPYEEFKIKITLQNYRYDPRYINVAVDVPETWSAEYGKNVFLTNFTTGGATVGKQDFEILINIGEKVSEVNNFMITLTSANHPLPLFIPITLLG